MDRRTAILGMGAAALGIERAINGVSSVQAQVDFEDTTSPRTDLLVDIQIGDTVIQYLTSRFRRAGNFYMLGSGELITKPSLYRVYDGDQARGPFLFANLLVTQPDLVSVSVSQTTAKYDIGRLDERYRINAKEDRPSFDGMVSSFRQRDGLFYKDDFLVYPQSVINGGFYQQIKFGQPVTEFIAQDLWSLDDGEARPLGFVRIGMATEHNKFTGAYAILEQHYHVTTSDTPIGR